MSDLQDSPEITHNPEHLTDEVLGGLLAAVGNHESKALIITAMQPEVAYGRIAAHRLFLDMQGDRPVHTGNEGVQRAYMSESFEPIGAVARVRFVDSLQYELTEEKGLLGKAVAGHLLAYSLAHPEVSLKQVFGMTTGTDPELRSPMRRFELLQELLSAGKGQGATELALALGQNSGTVYNHLRSLKSDGLVDLEEPEKQQRFSTYTAPEEIGNDYPLDAEASMAPTVVKIVNNLRANREVFTSKDVEDVILGDKYYATLKPSATVNRTRRVLLALEREGFLTKITDRGRDPTVVVRIIPEHRDLLEELVGVIYKLKENDPAYMKQGIEKGSSILADEGAVRTLVRKAVEHSPQANGVPKDERVALLIRFLREKEQASSDEIYHALEGKLTVASARKTLKDMSDNGLIRGERVKGTNIWSVVIDSAT